MQVSTSCQRLLNAAMLTILGIAFAGLPASAQQITYYNFDTPATASPSQYSYTCSTTSLSTNPLFCFNYQGSLTDPSFIQDPLASGTYATQMTFPQGSQASSMWFSVPQKVAGGFNVWFQFKITPSPASATPADGIAFVIQNAQGGGLDPTGSCSEDGSGPTAVGGEGGCIGYGGIDNSVALEFDTYNNGSEFGDPNGNHIALQDCGAGNANSPDHGLCEVTLPATSSAPAVPTLIENPFSSSTGNPVNLSDGNVHDVVIVYNGPLDTPANTISVYLDPAYTEGTHTPVAGSTPLFTGPFDITQAMNLLNSGSANDSAYVGFTSGTGAYFQTNEIMAWTFTPHTAVTQQQPLNPPGTPTTYTFGTHTYSVTYPSNADTSNIAMSVTAQTISPANFSLLLGLGPTQYTGSACQVYDDTGGNCIIYSTYCYNTSAPGTPVSCPPSTAPQGTVCTSTTDPNAADCIALTSTYDSSLVAPSPGFLQGDPLYSPVTSVVGNGNTATVNCAGECAASLNQTITVLNSNLTPEYSNVIVTAVNAVNQIVIGTPGGSSGTTSGGFLTSNNVQDNLVSYTGPNPLDNSSTEKTTNFSDFVVTDVTMIGSQMQLSAPDNNAAVENVPETLTATVSVPTNGGPNNLLLLLPSGSPGNTPGGSVSFSDNNGPVSYCQNVPLTAVTSGDVTAYQATCSYTPTAAVQDTIEAQYSGDAYHSGSQNSVVLNVSPQTVLVTVGTSPSGLTFAVVGPTALTSGTYNTQQTLTWDVDTNYSLYVPATTQTLPGVLNTQYVFSGWSNGLTTTGSPTDTVTAPATPASYTALFTTQYLLTATAGTGGTVTATNGYYNQGTVQQILATPNPGYVFSGWTGTGVGQVTSSGANSYSATMSGPVLITAGFTAVPVATVSPLNIDLGTLYLGSIVTNKITVSNTGAAPMTISDPFIGILPGANGNLSEFVTLNLCPKSLAAGKSCTMTVTFIAGPFYGQQTASLSVSDNAAGSPQTVMLSATVIDPQASLSPGSLSFGSVKTSTGSSTKSIVLTSSGGTGLSISGIGITGDTTDFTETSNCPVSPDPSVSLAPKAACTISVTFSPGTSGAHSASLVITDNTKSGAQTVPLTGTGK